MIKTVKLSKLDINSLIDHNNPKIYLVRIAQYIYLSFVFI